MAEAGTMIGSAIQGAGMGASFGPYGALIGAAGGLIMGAAAGDRGEMPSDVDAMEAARLAKLQQTVKQLETGTDPLTKLNIEEAKREGKTARRQISRVTGGDVGGTLSAFQRAQKATQTNINQSVAEAARRIPYFDSAAGALTSRIAQRKLELGLLGKAEQDALSSQRITDAQQNFNAAMMLGGDTTQGQGRAAENIPDTSGAFTAFQQPAPAGGAMVQPQQQPIILGQGAQQHTLLTDPSMGQVVPAYGSSVFY
jgi:hypothetical protein